MEATCLSGPAKNLLAFARLAGANATFQVATFLRARDPAPNAFVAACESAGIAVHPIRERRAFDGRVLAQMRMLADDLRPDILQSHSVKSHFLVRVAGLARRRHWIAFHHGYTSTNRRMGVYNTLDRFSLPAADRVVTVCAAFARDLTSRGVAPDRIVVRHNSVHPFAPPDEAIVAGARLAMSLSPLSRVLLAVGRLSREKGQADLIHAMALLKTTHPGLDLRLVLVGEGPDRASLEAAARQAGVGDRVTFAGQAGDVRPYYGMADVVVLPSLSEGSPNVLLEAMAAGVPVVSTDVGGIPEIACDGHNALLVPKRSPSALAAAVGRLLDDAGLGRRLSAAARDAAALRSPQEYCNSMLALYRELTALGGGSVLAAAQLAHGGR